MSAGKRVARLSGCSILNPTAPVYIVPNLGNVLVATASVMITDGFILSSMIKFFGAGVFICDCANVEILINVLYRSSCVDSSSISWVCCKIFEANVCVSILCISWCVCCVTGVCGTWGDLADIWKGRQWVSFKGGVC